MQSSVRGTLRMPRTFIFSLGQLRSIERLRIVETVETLTVETVQTVELNVGWDWIGLEGYLIPL